MQNKVLITGASGIVDTNLENYLKASHEGQPMSVRYLPNQQFDIKGGCLYSSCRKSARFKISVKYEANFELTKQLFDAFLASESAVFIFMSTLKAMADEVKGILTEDSIPNPKTHYGIDKHQAEEYILSLEVTKGKRVYILRPCMIHGPGNKRNLNLLYKLASKGIPWPLGNFKNMRSYLSIENLFFIIKELIEKDHIPSGVYNVADDVPLSTNEVIQLIAESKGKQSRILKLSKPFITTLARLGDFLKLPINSERLQKLTESYVVSNIKIKTALGKPLPISSKEGLLKTFQSFSPNV